MRSICYLLLVLNLFSCTKSGVKALENGNYFTAVMQSVEKLKKDSDSEKASEVLVNSYGLAQKELLKEINQRKNLKVAYKWEEVLSSYQKLNKMHDLISKCGPCRKIVNPVAYFAEEDIAKNEAAEERFNVGQMLLNKNNIDDARSAFNNFEKVFQILPNFENIRDKMEEALYKGSYHVLVEPSVLKRGMYTYSQEFFHKKVDDFLQSNKRMNKFVRFYTPYEVNANKIKTDHTVYFEFLDFSVGETLLKSDKETKISADSVQTGEVTVNGQKMPVKGKVKAEYIKYSKTVRSRGIILMEIRDNRSYRKLFSEEIGGEHNWGCNWASFNGDERALTKSELNLSKDREQMPPNNQQLFIEFTKPIYDQVTAKIKRFYEKY